MQADFESMYSASYRRVLRAVVLLAGSTEDAHDIAQEAFARAFSRWSAVRTLDSPEAWVKKVAVNLALDALRRDKSKRKALRQIMTGTRPQAEPNGDRVDVTRALAELNPSQREALALHYLLDMSVEQIAAELGRPAGTVKTNLARGRATLAEALRTADEVAADA